MTNNTIYIVYTAAIASELPQLDSEAMKTLDLRETRRGTQAGESYQTRGHLFCATMATKLPHLRMRRGASGLPPRARLPAFLGWGRDSV